MASQSQDVLLDVNTGYHSTSHRRTHSGVDSIATGSTSDKNTSTGSLHSSNTPSSKAKPTIRQLVMFYRRRLLKLSILVLLSLALGGVYLEFFKHPPADVLLVMNRDSLQGHGAVNDFGAKAFQKQPDEDCEDELECEGQSKGSINIRDPSEVEGADFWDGFLKRNNFVPIGAVYDKCENWRVQYGTVVLLPDKEFGGVKSRTFVNITLDQEISSGQFNIEVKYNGQDLYDNYWEVCELEDDVPKENRTFICPVQAGKHSRVKDKHVPIYLPTGHYQTKAWVTDESENMIACAYADFKL